MICVFSLLLSYYLYCFFFMSQFSVSSLYCETVTTIGFFCCGLKLVTVSCVGFLDAYIVIWFSVKSTQVYQKKFCELIAYFNINNEGIMSVMIPKKLYSGNRELKQSITSFEKVKLHLRPSLCLHSFWFLVVFVSFC